jgi:hypothetical protein
MERTEPRTLDVADQVCAAVHCRGPLAQLPGGYGAGRHLAHGGGRLPAALFWPLSRSAPAGLGNGLDVWHPGCPGQGVTATTTGELPAAQFRLDLTVGRRGVARWYGRLVVDDRELAVRSAVTRWIPARPVSKDAVGEISVGRRIEIHLPILRWRRMEIVSFDPSSAFADVSIKLSPRKHIVEVLRAWGYSVIERQ